MSGGNSRVCLLGALARARIPADGSALARIMVRSGSRTSKLLRPTEDVHAAITQVLLRALKLGEGCRVDRRPSCRHFPPLERMRFGGNMGGRGDARSSRREAVQIALGDRAPRRERSLEAVSKLQSRALTVSACNAVGPPSRGSIDGRVDHIRSHYGVYRD